MQRPLRNIWITCRLALFGQCKGYFLLYVDLPRRLFAGFSVLGDEGVLSLGQLHGIAGLTGFESNQDFTLLSEGDLPEYRWVHLDGNSMCFYTLF